MSSVKKWLDIDSGILIFKIIKEVKSILEGEKDIDWEDIVEWVFSYLSGEPVDNDKFKAALGKAVGVLELDDKVEKIKEFFDKPGNKGLKQLLTKCLNELDEKFVWEIIKKEWKPEQINGPWKSILDFEASANLGFEMEVFPPDKEVCGEKAPPNDLYLRMGINGNLSGSASAAVPIWFFKATGSVEANAGLLLDYYFSNPEDSLLIKAAASNIFHIPSPFEPVKIYEDSLNDLEAIHLTAFGSLGGSIGISGGTAWENTLKIVKEKIKLDKTIKMDASINLGFTASLKLQGSWDVWVYPVFEEMKNCNGDSVGTNVRKLNIKLVRGKKKEHSRAFSLDASLGIEGLNEVGDVLIKRYLPKADKLIKELEEYKNFGQLLKNKLKDEWDKILGADKDDTLKNAITDVLFKNATGQDVAEALGEKVETVINENLDLLEKDVNQAAVELLEGVGEKLGTELELPQRWIKPLVDHGSKVVEGILGKIIDGLQSKLKEIVEANKDTVAEFFAPLEVLAEQLKKWAEDLDSFAGKVLGPLLQFLVKYQKIRNIIADAVKSAAKLKLGVNFGHKVETLKQSEAALEFDLNVDHSKAEEYYKQMIRGDFRKVLEVCRDNTDCSAGVSLIGGELKDLFKKKVTSDLSLNLFGFNFKKQRILDSTIKVHCDPLGNVTLAANRAEIKEVKQWMDESQTIKFVNIMEFRGIGKSGEEKIMNAGVWLTYEDGGLKKKELVKFLNYLEEIGMTPEGTIENAKIFYDEKLSVGLAEKKLPAASIGFSMPLKLEHIQTLIIKPKNEVLRVVVEKMIETSYGDSEDRDEFNNSLSNFGKKWGGANVTEIIISLSPYYGVGREPKYSFENLRRKVRSVRDVQMNHILRASHIGRLAEHFAEFVDILNVMAYDEVPPGSDKDAIEDKLKKYNRKLQDSLDMLLAPKGSEKIHFATLGFMLAMAELGGMEKNIPVLTPILEYERNGKTHRELILGTKRAPAVEDNDDDGE